MKITVSTEVLKENNLTLSDFGVLLYYVGHGCGDISPQQTDKLWNMNLLTKVIDGYEFNPYCRKKIESWFVESEATKDKGNRYLELAEKLRAIFPEGSKQGKGNTRYPWRDNVMTIAAKLRTLEIRCKEVGITFTDEEVVEATQRYVNSFSGDKSYMQVLKYFILKKDPTTAEEKSTLINFIQDKNLGSHERTLFDDTDAFGEMV